MVHQFSLKFSLFVGIITLFLPLSAEKYSLSSTSPLTSKSTLSTHDFIIVGAGTSGCALTARLCESLPNSRILLLERSSPRNQESELKVRAARAVFDTWIDKGISSYLFTQASHSSNALLAISPNTIGGGSSINAGQLIMPPNGTFSNMFNISGLSDSRAFQLLHERIIPKIKPTSIGDYESNEWIKAAEQIGMKKLQNPLYESMKKYEDAAFTSAASFDENGRRLDSCTSYMPQRACGERLTILQNTQVDRLLFDKKKKNEIRGVKLSTGKEINATHQVILAAGPFESPKLLQLSGIGPSKILQRANILVKHNLPVGTYSQARAALAVLSSYKGDLSPNNDASLHTPQQLNFSKQQFLKKNGLGILSRRIGGANGVLKDLGEITMVTGFPLSHKFPGQQLFNRNVIRSTCVLDTTATVFSPLSVISQNASVPPHIEFNALKSIEDRNRMAKCIQKLRDLHSKISFTNNEIEPGTKDLNMYITEKSQNGQHYVGGCAVGKVVNSNFQVKGMKGLSVVDASVIPTMPKGAGPMTAVYIIAEHAANVIAERYRIQI